MINHEAEDIAQAWIAMHLAPYDSDGYHSNFWAYQRLSQLCEDDPDFCWMVINAIRKIDSSDIILSNLAAGPLEDLLVSHGEMLIDKLETEAKMDQQLRKLLGVVWKNDINDAVWERIVRIADKPW